MKKLIALFTVGTVSCFFSFSFLTIRNETTDLYVKCLKNYIRELEKDGSGNIRDTINIIDNGVVDLPLSIGKYTLRIINDTASSLFSGEERDIVEVELFPIKVENEKIEIDLGEYLTTKDKRGIILEYTGGFTFYFKYDCSKNRYTLINFKVNSI